MFWLIGFGIGFAATAHEAINGEVRGVESGFDVHMVENYLMVG